LVKAYHGLELKFFRRVADEVGDHLKLGEAELGIACPLREPWERLESWVLFTERFELAVPRAHPFAMRNTLTLAQISQARLLPRSYDEQAEALERILDEHGLTLDVHDRIGSDHDLMALLAANVGVSIMPRSARTTDAVRFLPLEDFELVRPVVLYAVAGRQRSPAATGLLRLLRSADWPMILGSDACAPKVAPA
jgi:DNA-binding transcriptional LysR family regulator